MFSLEYEAPVWKFTTSSWMWNGCVVVSSIICQSWTPVTSPVKKGRMRTKPGYDVCHTQEINCSSTMSAKEPQCLFRLWAHLGELLPPVSPHNITAKQTWPKPGTQKTVLLLSSPTRHACLAQALYSCCCHFIWYREWDTSEELLSVKWGTRYVPEVVWNIERHAWLHQGKRCMLISHLTLLHHKNRRR